jgi:4,5-dihydroxyphthalate decarboxylase
MHATAAVTCRTLLGTYPATAALKRGDLRSSLVQFDFAGAPRAYTEFKALVRDHAFDVGELAIVTYLQARTFGTPYLLLPAVVAARNVCPSLVYNPARGMLAPRDLAGRRVGVRAYTQTTGAWLRGILEEDYGVDIRQIRWITFEDPHVAEYRDPPWTERARARSELLQMLIDGSIDAAIFGAEPPDAPVTPVIPDAEAAGARWAARHGGTPINHMIVVHESIGRARPDIVREFYRLLIASRDAAGSVDEGIRFGVDRVRGSLERIIEFGFRQALLPRRITVDELFDPSIRAIEASCKE